MAQSYNLNDAAVVIMGQAINGILSNPAYGAERMSVASVVSQAYNITLASVAQLTTIVGDMSVAVPTVASYTGSGFQSSVLTVVPAPSTPPPPTYVEPGLVNFSDGSIAPIRGATASE